MRSNGLETKCLSIRRGAIGGFLKAPTIAIVLVLVWAGLCVI
jgi:hypothetical protein